MPKLTTEDLANIYPDAKTYDERQLERAWRDERRRPRLVALKISCWLALSIPTMLLTYHATTAIAANLDTSTSSVLATVAFGLLVLIFGVATLYHLYRLTSDLAYKTIAATTILYRLLMGVLFVAGLIFALASLEGWSELEATAAATGWTLIGAFAATHFVLKRQ